MAKIERTKSGKYHASVYMGKDDTGKRHFESITHYDRRVVAREVERLEQLRRNGAAGTAFSDAIESYIKRKKAVLSPATVREYTSIKNTLKTRHGAFYDLTAYDIRKEDLQDLVNALVAGGASPKHVRNVYGLVASVLRNIDVFVPKVALPERVRPNLHEPTKEEIRTLLSAVEGTRLEIPVKLGIHGLRAGEICALEFPADFADGYIHVSKSLARSEDGFVMKSPKNITSNRFVPIDDKLLAIIRKQGFVTNMTPHYLSKRFSAIIKQTGLPHIRFHDLRHFFASYMHEQGLSDAQIMRMGGWTTDNVMKRVYRYAIDNKESDRRVAALLTEL